MRSAEILEVMSTDEIGTTLPVYLYSASSYSVVALQTGTEILGAPASEGDCCGAARRGETRNAASEICKAIFGEIASYEFFFEIYLKRLQ